MKILIASSLLIFIAMLTNTLISYFLLKKEEEKTVFIEPKKEISISEITNKAKEFFILKALNESNKDNIELLGTAYYPYDPFLSLALLNVDGETLILRESQDIKNTNYKLEKILPDKIILKDNSTKEELTLKIENEKQENKNAALPPLSSLLNTYQIPKNELLAVTKDPGIMFREIRLVPYVENGKTKGFIFDWVEPNSLFDKMGIRKGDILVDINGQKIESGTDAFRILQIIRNDSSFRVGIIRDGKYEELNYEVI